jgi:hypothetical protein
MSWNRRHDRRDSALGMAAEALASTPTKADILNCAQNDYDRMLLCADWQSRARSDWFLGQRNTILMVLQHTGVRWAGYSVQQRKHIGERLWSSDPRSKELADAEQMYARWVLTYEALYRSALLRERT